MRYVLRMRLWILALTGATVSLTGCQPVSVAQASAQCDAKAVEARLEDLDRMRHKNLCMMGMGFKRTTACDAEPTYRSSRTACYDWRWKFWVEEARIVE